jgi:predicted transcriptional regulator
MQAALTLSLPDDLLKQIEERARERGRPVDMEAVQILRQFFEDDAREAQMMEEIRKDREEAARQGLFIDDEFINQAKRWGRE